MVVLSVLTILSEAYGCASMMMDLSDKIQGWKKKKEIERDPNYYRSELLRQLEMIQEKTYDSTLQWIRAEFSSDERESVMRSLDHMVSTMNSEYSPSRKNPSYVEVSYDDEKLNRVQQKLWNDVHSTQRKNMEKVVSWYSDAFHLELCSGKYEMLIRWYNYCFHQAIHYRAKEMTKILVDSQMQINYLCEGRSSMQAEVEQLSKTTRKSLQLLESFMISVAVSLLGSYGVWLWEKIWGNSLNFTWLIALPISFFSSCLFLAFVFPTLTNQFPAHISFNRRLGAGKRFWYRLLEVVIPTTVQAVIVQMLLVIVQRMLDEVLPGWIGLLIGSLMIQSVLRLRRCHLFMLSRNE